MSYVIGLDACKLCGSQIRKSDPFFILRAQAFAAVDAALVKTLDAGQFCSPGCVIDYLKPKAAK